MSDESQASEVVRYIWDNGIASSAFEDPRTPSFAKAALSELVELRDATPGIFEEALRGADLGANQLAVEDTHGLTEVIQNADDQGATQITLGIRYRSGQPQLAIVHNGTPIRIQDVLAMCFAFVSTKRDDPSLIGKFGVGLKTLSRLADRFEVHCKPYHFEISGSRVKEIPATRINSYYDPQTDDTLLVLPLRDKTLEPLVKQWAQSWQAHAMLFLRHLRSFSWIDTARSKTVFTRRLTVPRREEWLQWGTGTKVKHIRVSHLGDTAGKRQWTRYDMETVVPKRLLRAFKATGTTTTVSIAVPNKTADTILYTGLPTKIRLRTPFAVGASFDPDTSRTQILQSDWNRWLWKQVGELVATASLALLERNPATAWPLIITSEECRDSNDSWIQDRITEVQTRVASVVRSKGHVLNGQSLLPLSRVSYEDNSLDGLLSSEDYSTLAPRHHQLEAMARDSDGRWRTVLDDLEIGRCLELSDALRLLPSCAEQPLSRSPEWYLEVVSKAIAADLGEDLQLLPCVLVDSPVELLTPNSAGVLFSIDSSASPLASRLGVVRKLHDAFLGDKPKQIQVREWLADRGQLRHQADTTALLQAIVRRGTVEPIEVSDEDLVELRDLVDELDDPDRELLQHVGLCLVIDAYQWSSNRQITQKSPIASVYLPAVIAGGGEPWPKVAARTPGLVWAAGKYSKLFEPGGRGSENSGARRFLGLLGAHAIFRLEHHPRHYIWQSGTFTAPTSRFQQFPRRPDYLRDDWTSSDLETVIDDISKVTSNKNRERGLALVALLKQAWRRSLQQHAYSTACYERYGERVLGEVLTSWIGMLVESPWLFNETGQPAKPSELSIRSGLTETLFGDAKDRFASGILAGELPDDLIEILQFEKRPIVSTVVDLISRLRSSGEGVDWSTMRVYYAYLSDMCPEADRSVSGDTMVGDLTVSQLRGFFGIKSGAPGLIAVNGYWFAPSAIFRGRPIFGSRRAFVPEDPSCEKLWNVLRIREPQMEDCIDVLKEISSDEQLTSNASVLADTYRRIDFLLNSGTSVTARDRRQLATVPLWCGSEWIKKRPIFYIADEIVSNSLSVSYSMWDPQCSIEGMETLVHRLGVTVIPRQSCAATGIDNTAYTPGERLQDSFASKVEALKDYLARNNPSAYGDIQLGWDELKYAHVAIAPRLGLEITMPAGVVVEAKTNAYLTFEPPTVYVIDELALFGDAGARIVSEFFGTLEHRQTVRLAWSNPNIALKNHGASLDLAMNYVIEGDPLATLESSASSKVGKPIVGKRSTARKVKFKAEEPSTNQPRLKSLESFSVETVQIVNSKTPRGQRRAVAKILPPTRPSGSTMLISNTQDKLPKGYTPDDREQLALKLLEAVLRNNESALKDFTRIKGLGADAGDDINRLFEIKAHGQEMPNSINIQWSQILAATERPDDFYLAVVSGLEEGYTTTIRLFHHPLQTLDWQEGTSFKLSGIRSKKALEITLSS